LLLPLSPSSHHEEACGVDLQSLSTIVYLHISPQTRGCPHHTQPQTREQAAAPSQDLKDADGRKKEEEETHSSGHEQHENQQKEKEGDMTMADIAAATGKMTLAEGKGDNDTGEQSVTISAVSRRTICGMPHRMSTSAPSR
jgi:hypothetical protein